MFGGEVGVEGMYMCTLTNKRNWTTIRGCSHRSWYTYRSGIGLFTLAVVESTIVAWTCLRCFVDAYKLAIINFTCRRTERETVTNPTHYSVLAIDQSFVLWTCTCLVIINFSCRRRERETVTNPPPCSVLAIELSLHFLTNFQSSSSAVIPGSWALGFK